MESWNISLDMNKRYKKEMRVTSEIKHIVWDWNGTILDDNHVMLDSVNEVCRHYGRPEINMETWRDALCRPLWRCYGKILERELTWDDWSNIEQIYHDAYRKYIAQCRLAVDAHGILDSAKNSGFSQSLLSMGFHDDVTAQIDRFSIQDFFVRIDGVLDPVAGGKKAEYLATHLERMNMPPEHCVVVGDVVDDADAAHRVGAECVLVTTGMSGYEELRESGFPVESSLTGALQRISKSSASPALGSLIEYK